MNCRHSVLSILALLGAALTAHGAGVYTEDFQFGLRNWVGTNESGSSGTWDWDSGSPRLTFAPVFTPFDFTESSLIADKNSSEGYFYGSYFVAGYPMIGFDFMFETAVPSLLRVDFYSGTNHMSRGWRPDEEGIVTQQWYRALIALDANDLDHWAFSSSSDDFEDIANNVERLAITVKRPGPINQTQTVRIDNVFLATAPHATAVRLLGDTPAILWQYLRTGLTYQIETTASLPGEWLPYSTFIATNAALNLEFTPTTNSAFFRLKTDALQPR